MQITPEMKSRLPATLDGGYVPTLNKMGFQTPEHDWVTESFVKRAKDEPGEYADIGSGYGFVTLDALHSQSKITAVDAHGEHLKILRESIPAEIRDGLKTKEGFFPSKVDFNPTSLDGVLLARLLSLLNPDQLEEGLKKVYAWLKPDSRLFIVTSTPFQAKYQNAKELFEKNRTQGKRWPGFFAIEDADPGLRQWLPENFHVFTKEDLTKYLEEIGFEVMESRYFTSPNYPDQLKFDGREALGLIAKKHVQT